MVAMEILRGEGDQGGATRPDLILLDLRLPRKDGPEVLADINSDEGLVNIPVMILTGTEAEQSLLNAYNIPPSRFCRKPIELQRFNNVVAQLGMFSRQPISLGTSGRTGGGSAVFGRQAPVVVAIRRQLGCKPQTALRLRT